jgi:hypothetical protein
MSNIKFEWDPKKASANEKKHGITFDEARTVFFDECQTSACVRQIGVLD